MIDLTGRKPKKPETFDTEAKALLDRLRQEVMDREASTLTGSGKPKLSFKADFWQKYKDIFKAAQNHKCCYCDSKLTAVTYGVLEHYRPKGEVTEPINQHKTSNLTVIATPGYWWLAYDWDIWLCACEVCNTSYKRTLFPVEVRLPIFEGVEKEEKPLLLNPYKEDPATHFTFLETGEVSGESEAGRVTIATCGLDREELNVARGEHAAALTRQLNDLKQTLQEHERRNSSFVQKKLKSEYNELKSYLKEKSAYVAMSRQLLSKDSDFQRVQKIILEQSRS